MNYEGEIRDVKLVERLIELWREQFTGAIRFENDGVIKIIYFKGGDILSASTNDRADSVDEILMRAGKVSKEHVKQALAKRKESETLGDALLNLGFITRKELTWARRIQVINVIRSIEEWNAGSFTVVADYLPKREEGTIFPLPQLVVEMIVTDQDRGKFERALESGAVVFTKAAGHEETFRKLGLNEDAEAVMGEVDGIRAATEVAAASRQETFNAFKLLHALAVLGILEKRTSSSSASGLGFESAGVADAADAWGGSPSPQFTLDDEPASDSSSLSMSDDIAPLPGIADPSSASEPSWDAPAPISPPPPAMPPSFSIEPDPPAVEEPKWGFDEGLLETARKASVAAPLSIPEPEPSVPSMTEKPRLRPPATIDGTTLRRPPIGETTTTRRAAAPVSPRKSSRFGLVVALIGVFVLAALGYFGWIWWQSRGDAAVAQVSTSAATTTTTAAPVPATATVPAAATGSQPATPTTEPPAALVPAPVPVPAPSTAKVPASTPPATPDRARYEAMAREFAANPSGRFAVQFAIVCEPANVTGALRASTEVWFTPIRVKERSCFRLFYGRYETREEAERALPQLPGELRESRPSVVTIPR